MKSVSFSCENLMDDPTPMLTFASYVDKREREDWRILGMNKVQSHFLDSGAFTLWTKAAKWAKENGRQWEEYYELPEFWQYMDDYANFVKKYKAGIDLYANVDAIPNPEITWRNQKYLEKKHGLKPVPVVHYTTDLKWLKRYIKRGYEVIGLGGLVGSTAKASCQKWIDECFGVVCPGPSRLPVVKLHGFGVTTHKLLVRYPWWSVDSVTWAKLGGFGSILVPRRKRENDRWVFDFLRPPYQMTMSVESGSMKVYGKHYNTRSEREQQIACGWLESIGIPLGKMDGEEVAEFGVMTRHTERRAANIHYFEGLRKALPEWPWPFKTLRKNREAIC